jgi:hypothetical protein
MQSFHMFVPIVPACGEIAIADPLDTTTHVARCALGDYNIATYATHPYRTLSPLWADALELLGIRTARGDA